MPRQPRKRSRRCQSPESGGENLKEDKGALFKILYYLPTSSFVYQQVCPLRPTFNRTTNRCLIFFTCCRFLSHLYGINFNLISPFVCLIGDDIVFHKTTVLYINCVFLKNIRATQSPAINATQRAFDRNQKACSDEPHLKFSPAIIISSCSTLFQCKIQPDVFLSPYSVLCSAASEVCSNILSG